MACFKSFCCCCTLKTGTFVAGSVSFVLSSIFLHLIICFIRATEEIEEIMIKATNRSSGDVDPQLTTVRYLFIGGSILTALTAAASLLLIFGATKRYRPLLIPWVVISTIDLIIVFVAVVVWLTSLGPLIKPNNHEEIYLDVLSLIIGVALTIYLFAIVCSHFKELNKRRKEKILILAKEKGSRL